MAVSKITSADGDLTPISDIKGRLKTEIIFSTEQKKFRKTERVKFDFYELIQNAYLHINMCFKEIIDGIYKIFGVDQEASQIILRDFK